MSASIPPTTFEPTEPGFRLGAGIDFTDPNSPLAPYYLRSSQVAAVAVLGVVFLLLCYVPVWHTDIWGHLGQGRAIVTQGRLLVNDPLCPYSEPGMPTLHYSWLAQSGFYLVYHAGELLAGGDALNRAAGGAEMLRLMHATLVTLKLLLLLLAFRRLTGSSSAALVGILFVVLASFGNIAVLRPQVIGELFFAALLLAVSRPVMTRRALILTPLLLTVWANAHASFAVGLVLLAILIVGRSLESARDNHWSLRAVLADPRVRRPAAALLLSTLLVAAANPWGPLIYRNLLEMSAHPVVRLMDEWQPIRFTSGGGRWVYIATAIFVGLGLLLARRLPTPTAIILTLVFASQPLLHQRTFVWWLMLAPWVALPAWNSLLERIDVESVPSFRKTLLTASLAFLAIAWSPTVRWALTGAPAPLHQALSNGTPLSVSLALRQQPQGLSSITEVLEKNYPEQRYTGGIFASETLGDYLLWDLPSQYPVFAYSHVHLFSPQHWQRIATVRRAEPGWQAILANHRINLVVVEAEQNARLCALLRQDADWTVVTDETGWLAKRDSRCRLFVALRVRPL